MRVTEFEKVGEQVKRKALGKGVSIAIVRSLFRSELTQEMQRVVEKRSIELGAKITAVKIARGALETPLLARQLLLQKNIDGVVVLAAVVRGKTKHDEVVVFEATGALISASFESGKPVGIGIIGPGVTMRQARNRVREYAQGALDAVVLSFDELKRSN